MVRNRLVWGLVSAVVLTMLDAGAAYAQAPKVPLPGSAVLLVAGAAGLAIGGWWTRRK